MKWVCAVAVEKRLLSSVLLNLRSELPSEMYLTARSMHSSRGMLVKSLLRPHSFYLALGWQCFCFSLVPWRPVLLEIGSSWPVWRNIGMCQMGEFWNKFSCLFIVLKVLSQSLMDELKAGEDMGRIYFRWWRMECASSNLRSLPFILNYLALPLFCCF